MCSKYEQHLFKLFHNEIILDEKSTWNTCLNGTDYNKFNIIEVNEKGDFIIIKYGKIYKNLELTYINNEKVENIFIEKMKDELYRKKKSNINNKFRDKKI